MSETLPQVCRLLPLCPGYVMTVCEETKTTRHEAAARREVGKRNMAMRLVEQEW